MRSGARGISVDEWKPVAKQSGTGRRVAILTNILQPYRVAVFQELAKQCQSLQIFVSSPIEDRRRADAAPRGLRVVQQRSIEWRDTEHHAHRFTQPLQIQFPYDTLTQLKRFRPDVIVSAELGLRTLQAAVYRRFAVASRLVVWAALSEVTEQARGKARQILRRALLGLADAVMVNGESGAHYVERFGAPRERVFRVPQTTDVAPFLALPVTRREQFRRRLLYCGRLIELKGLIPFLSHLADWAKLHPAQRVEFSIAGDGPLQEALATYSAPPNLSIKLLGKVAYDRLPEVYAQNGLLAFPTLADEWGMVVVEAMASALPVLGSVYSQAVEELVVDGKTGWAFRPDDPAAVKTAIHRALTASSEELDLFGLGARQQVKTMTPAAMANQIVAAVDFACSPFRKGTY
jgi:glycosyltransferase involved in cell wall biosynthesis